LRESAADVFGSGPRAKTAATEPNLNTPRQDWTVHAGDILESTLIKAGLLGAN